MDMSKPAVFHILLALAEGDAHGYAIMQTVREQSEGRVPLQTASLYRHLAQLIRAGYITEASLKAPADPRRGTHYRLTQAGRVALDDERQRLTRLLTAMRGIKATSKGRG